MISPLLVHSPKERGGKEKIFLPERVDARRFPFQGKRKALSILKKKFRQPIAPTTGENDLRGKGGKEGRDLSRNSSAVSQKRKAEDLHHSLSAPERGGETSLPSAAEDGGEDFDDACDDARQKRTKGQGTSSTSVWSRE